MITNFEDFVLWMYVVIDDCWQQVAPLYRRPGPAPACSDSELLTMLLVGECLGWDTETSLLAHWQRHRDLFPVLPERSRLNRRRRQVQFALNDVRRVVLGLFDLAQDRQCAIDSLPIPVIQFHLCPSSAAAVANWAAYGAAFGKVPTKKQTIFGYKLHLLVTLGGVILDFELAGANCTDLAVGVELLYAHHDLEALGDKGYISAPLATALWQERGVRLVTVPRANQRRQLPAEVCQLINRWRQIIETVNDQLTEQFQIGRTHAHSFSGLCARLYSKLTAHTLCLYLNRLLGESEVLQIKRLAFPI